MTCYQGKTVRVINNYAFHHQYDMVTLSPILSICWIFIPWTIKFKMKAVRNVVTLHFLRTLTEDISTQDSQTVRRGQRLTRGCSEIEQP